MSLHVLLAPLVSLALVTVPPQTEKPDVKPSAPLAGPSLLVLNKSDNTLTYWNAGAERWSIETATGVGPHEVAVSPDQQFAVVADYGARAGGTTLTVVQLQLGTVRRTIDLGEFSRPHGIVFSGPRRVLVTCEAQRRCSKWEAGAGGSTNVAPLPLPGRVRTTSCRGNPIWLWLARAGIRRYR